MSREASFYHGFEERSGKLYEIFLLGEVKSQEKEYRIALVKCKGLLNNERFLCALELVKKFQPSDPKNPKKIFLRDMRDVFAKELGLSDKEASEQLGVFTARGSLLDFDYGIDAFVEWRDRDGTRVASFDVSLNKQKQDYPEDIKADILIGELPDRNEQQKAYFEKVREIAKRGVGILKTKKAF